MMPIRELLNKIRWDREFGAASFEVGYLDHLRREIVRVSLRRLHFEEGNRFSFQVEDEWGETLDIPFHRIREVRRNGETVWKRPN